MLQRAGWWIGVLIALASGAQASYLQHPEAKAWMDTLVSQGVEKAEVEKVLSVAKKQQSILDAMSRPAEKRLDWGGYRKIFMTKKRISRGVTFWQQNAAALQKAEATYGVPAEVIVSIIGVETHYGRIMGNYRAVDALATLGFDYPRRGEFFRGQLKDLMTVAAQEGKAIDSFKSSYAGAMGYGQFIPSSFLAYAIDFDGDGKRDMWRNTTDAIGSVANYFKQHGWVSGEHVVLPVTVPRGEPIDINTGLKPSRALAHWLAEGVVIEQSEIANDPAVLLAMRSGEKTDYYLGFNNYYVITRYNRSRLYAMAVHELSQAVAHAYRGG